MTQRTLPALLTLAGLATLTAACGPSQAYKTALANGKRAEQRGDLVTAVTQYRLACKANKDDKQTCKRADDLGQQVYAASINGAATTCNPPGGAGPADYQATQACLDTLAPARVLYPTDQQLLQIVDFVGTAQIARCTSQPAKSPISAVQVFACAAAFQHELDTPAHRDRLSHVGVATAQIFGKLGESAAMVDKPGARYLLWSAARCLSPTSEIKAQTEQTWRAFLATSAVPVVVRTSSGPDGRTLCSQAAGNLGAALQCQGQSRSSQAPITVDVGVDLGSVAHQVTEEPQEHRFQVGVRRFENPEYRTALRRVEMAQQAFNDIEPETNSREAACNSADSAWRSGGSCQGCAEVEERDRICNQYNALVPIYNERKNELADAKSALASTQQIIEEPQYDTFRYVVRHHTWSLPVRAQLQTAGFHVEPGTTITFSDDEHDGSQRAGVARDPLTPPSGGWYVDELTDLLVKNLVPLAQREVGKRGETRSADCTEEGAVWNGAWLHCWAEAALWSGRDPNGLQLLGLISRASAAAGTPVPPLACQ